MANPALLYLHNGSQPAGASNLPQRLGEAGLDVDYFWALNNEFPIQLDHYQAVFISGSPHGAYEDIPFIHREHELIGELVKLDIPILGVCFGSQILASALCGREQVFRRSSCEVGFKQLKLTPAAASDPLTRQLGATVENFVWHNDEVRVDHPDMVVLASSVDCPNQIWRFRDRPVWGIQGHPELTQAEAIKWFEADRAYFEKDGANVAELQAAASEQSEAKTMLTSFINLCRSATPTN